VRITGFTSGGARPPDRLGAGPGILLIEAGGLTKLVNSHSLQPGGTMPKRRPTVRETVTLYEAKTHLSALVERAAGGEEIVIAKGGKPKALLVPLPDTRPERTPGQGRGRWRVHRDFDAPLPDDVLDAFDR
jgi:prevent-host-death family protein